MRLHRLKYFYLFVLCWTLSFSQSNIIKNVRLHSVSGNLTINPELNDFFNEDIFGAVKSGMNVTFHYYIELHNSKKEVLFENEKQINVRNDIWENIYTISDTRLIKKIAEFEKFKRFILDSVQFNIKMPVNIKENTKLKLYLTFSPREISVSQKEIIRTWLTHEDNESESTLSLNISKLISFFMSDEKKEDLSIYQSELFTLKTLTANENPKK